VKRNKLKGCPEREDFVRFCLGESDEGAMRQFLDHALICPVCRPRLRLLTKLRADVEPKGDGIPDTGLTHQASGVLRKMAADRLRSLRPAARPLRLRLLPLGAVASIGLIALVAGYLFLRNAPSSNFAVRGGAHLTLRLLEPGVKSREAPTTFSWSDVKGRDDFLFVLVNNELDTIYEAGTTATQLSLPDAVRQELKRGVTYLWTVRALEGSGRELAWASREFQIE
jgi:hypothetical protein